MVNEQLREELQERADGALLFYNNLSYDEAIIGLTNDERVAYSFSKMVTSAMKQLDCREEEAIEWIEYNTLRAYSNDGNMPIVIYDDFMGE